MNFQNVTIKWLGDTATGVSKTTGNEWKSKDAVIGIGEGNEQFPQGIVCKTFNKDVIEILERAGVGATLVSVDIDFNYREYNGKWYQDNRLWRIGATQPQPSAVQQLNDLGF